MFRTLYAKITLVLLAMFFVVAGLYLALTLMTIAVAIQGFLGAAVTHGMEHMMF